MARLCFMINLILWTCALVTDATIFIEFPSVGRPKLHEEKPGTRFNNFAKLPYQDRGSPVPHLFRSRRHNYPIPAPCATSKGLKGTCVLFYQCGPFLALYRNPEQRLEMILKGACGYDPVTSKVMICCPAHLPPERFKNPVTELHNGIQKNPAAATQSTDTRFDSAKSTQSFGAVKKADCIKMGFVPPSQLTAAKSQTCRQKCQNTFCKQKGTKSHRRKPQTPQKPRQPFPKPAVEPEVPENEVMFLPPTNEFREGIPGPYSKPKGTSNNGVNRNTEQGTSPSNDQEQPPKEFSTGLNDLSSEPERTEDSIADDDDFVLVPPIREEPEGVQILPPIEFDIGAFGDIDQSTSNTEDIDLTEEELPNPVQAVTKERKCPVEKVFRPKVIGPLKVPSFAEPWLGLISYDTNDGPKFLCTASLVSDNWLLTSAQCLQGRTPRFVRLGEQDLNRTSESQHQDYPIIQQAVHEGFNPLTMENDLAALKINVTTGIPDFVCPLLLPESRDALGDLTGLNPFVAGWDINPTDGPTINTLFDNQVEILSNRQCSDFHNVTDLNICAYYDAGCTKRKVGDPGGGIYQPRKNGDVTYLVGIRSSIAGCQSPAPVAVIKYIKVSEYLDWINRIILTSAP